MYQRFTAWLDPTHLHPWHYYFTELFVQMTSPHTFWLAVLGAVLVLIRLLRRPWREGAILAMWFALPMAAMSCGTSKIWHYSYPFLPPVALAAGYLLSWLLDVLLVSFTGLSASQTPFPRLLARRAILSDRAIAAAHRLRGRYLHNVSVPRRSRPVRAVAGAVSVICLCVAVDALVSNGRLPLIGHIVRSRLAVPPAILFAVAAGLAGYGLVGARVAILIAVLTLAPISAYRDMLPRLLADHHPLRSARDCLNDARNREHLAGRATPAMVSLLTGDSYAHQYFYYLRDFGWDYREGVSDDDIRAMVKPSDAQRLVLLTRSRYQEAGGPHSAAVPLGGVLLLTPGPYAGCGRR